MGDINQKITVADQVFINAVAYLCCTPSLNQAHAGLALAGLRDVMPVISRGHAFIEPIAREADRMLNVQNLKDVAERRETYSSARYRAAAACGAFFFWRFGLAEAALRAARKKETTS